MHFIALQKLGRNGERWRFWIESQRLARLGFAPGTPLAIQGGPGALTLRPAILGGNHVSSRLVPGGRRPIIDLANQSLLAGLADYSEVKIVASYERIQVSPSHRAFAIQRSRTLVPPLRVLEVFAGGGTMTAALQGNASFQVVAGVEIEPDFADEWQAQHPDATLVQSDTVANLFGHMAGKQKGLVEIWDVVGFDEVADLEKMPKEVVTTLKTFCESGQFLRGQEPKSGYASIAMFGNTQQPVEVMVQTGHLFEPMPECIRNDMAFLDRIHFYLPGWEVPKMRNEHFTSHYGFVVDYLAEALRDLRKQNYTEALDQHFALGSHLNARDRKAVRRAVSGLIKILHPHGRVEPKDLEEILQLAIEGRRRVKEQLKKMGAFEYYQTSFSYLENRSGAEHFVGVPEQGGRNMISLDPTAPGTVYAASVSGDGTVGLYRLEVSLATGTGKLRLAGGVSGALKESIQRAFGYLMSNKGALGVAREVETSDFHVESIDLLGNRVEAEIGVAFLVACYSALRKAPTQPGLVVLGDLSIQGNIKAVRSLVEPLQVAMDNGARKAMIPVENKRNFLEVSGDTVEKVDPAFYSDPQTVVLKALGLT